MPLKQYHKGGSLGSEGEKGHRPCQSRREMAVGNISGVGKAVILKAVKQSWVFKALTQSCDLVKSSTFRMYTCFHALWDS